MANREHLARLKKGVQAWNRWRESNSTKADLSKANLSGANLSKADLSEAELMEANLSGANLSEADLNGANLQKAHLSGANLTRANLREAKLSWADLSGADLSGANLSEAYLLEAYVREAYLREANLNKAILADAHLIKAYLNKAILAEADLSGANLSAANLHEAYLTRANLREANLSWADLSGADLSEATLSEANLSEANLSKADLSGANLLRASLVETNLEDADLTGCSVYGISVWNARLDGVKQSNLLITPREEPAIRVDSLEVAQFIYLLLNNAKIRHVIDTITSKVVLILGRFTPERKVVLDAIREELRKRDFVPVLFDFEKPDSKNLTGTITTLAKMARFIIADLTEPSSVPHELAMIVPTTKVAVQAVLLEGHREYSMFADLMVDYHWVLEPYQYNSLESLLDQLNERVIAPAETKAKELTRK